MGKLVPREIEMPVVGMRHRMTPSTLRMLNRNLTTGTMPVLIEREPKNSHDRNAIKVVVEKGKFKGMHIGYIPRNAAALLAPAMDDGDVTDAHGILTDVDEDGDGTMLLFFKGAVIAGSQKSKAQSKADKRKPVGNG